MKFFKKMGRPVFCVLLVGLFFLGYEARLFQWQVLEVETYRQESLENQTDTIEMEAARGQILDRNGNILAGNKTVYQIVYNALDMVYEERNATIIKVIDLLEERGETWRDVLPIELDGQGGYQFPEGREESVSSLKETLGLAEYATAQDCMQELSEKYRCGGYSAEDTRNVAAVRYSMTKDGFSRTDPYVFAQDVSSETVGVFRQMAGELPGVEARVDVARYYGEDGALAPHVVGYTGAISDWQLEQAEENGEAYDYSDNISGYKWDDTIGVDGLENAFEKDLRGKRGQETIFNDDTGDVKSTAVTVQPQEGNTVYTTLDSDLQRAANISLKKNILGNTEAKDCVAGAAVVLDVKDFGVLACASYPTYDLNLYTTDDKYIAKLYEDETKPMYNRALDGVFVPGSVFKPMVALAALQEGAISAATGYTCTGTFVYGDDPDTALQLGCLCGGGGRDVYSGLAKSCNTFFCNTGLNLTIRKMDAYAECFGLGEKTGVELGESVGVMSNPQEYQENHGTPWLDGVSAQTAIGQADNQFTPIQLAAYCATMANGGKRLQTHFLQKVTDYMGKEVLEEYQPRELYDAGLSSDVLGVVREGMIGCASYGTAADVFGEYPVAIACKTGTAETTSLDPDAPGATQANISFICYAPAQDPEIAVAVMIEFGHKGDYAKNVAKDILDQYFGYYTWDQEGNRYNQSGDMVDDQGKVLKTKAELDREKEQEEQKKQEEFLSSAIEGGETSDGQVSSSVSQPETSSGTGREDIPTTPYTGESSQTAASKPETTSSSPVSSGGRDSPYYTGGSSSGSG